MTQRLFLGIRPSDAAIDALCGLQWGLRRVRWQMPDQLHLTVRFLGELPNAEAERVVAGLQDIALPPLHLQLQGVGHFGGRAGARVLWAGLRDEDGVLALRDRVDRQLGRLGIGPDRRRLRPHVTLARVGDADDAQVAAWLQGHGLFRSEVFAVPSLVVYRSILRPEGAEYRRLRSLRLAGEPAYAG